MAEAGSGSAGGYVAFISYSHKDAAIGRWLHRKLEGYRLPRRLAGTQGEDGEVPARLTPIFRDRDELPAAGDLSERVRAALALSRNLIVLCSPNSAASPWVAKEIATFRELHPGRPVFTAIVDGEPGQCFSPALLEGGVEPLAADLRKEGDGRRLGLLKLVAGLAGVGLDALVQRDATRRVRRVTYVTAIAVMAMLVMALLTAFALNARAEAERQRAEAEGLVEFMLTDLRENLKGVTNLAVLSTVNERALDYYRRQDLKGLPAQSLEKRARILHALGEDDAKRDRLDRALAHFEEAKRWTGELLRAEPDSAERLFLHAQSEYWVGNIAERRSRYDVASAAYQRYRSAAVRMHRLQPKSAKYLGELAYSESNLGIVELNGYKRPQAARRHFQNSLHWFTLASKAEPARDVWLSEIADAKAWLADTWFEERRFQEALAERAHERSLKLALLRRDPSNVHHRFALVVTARAIAKAESAIGQPQQALALLNSTAPEMRRLLALDEDNTAWRTQAARIEIDASQIHQSLGQKALRIAALRRADALLSASKSLSSDEALRLKKWVKDELAAL
jgi:hypothetical protein